MCVVCTLFFPLSFFLELLILINMQISFIYYHTANIYYTNYNSYYFYYYYFYYYYYYYYFAYQPTFITMKDEIVPIELHICSILGSVKRLPNHKGTYFLPGVHLHKAQATYFILCMVYNQPLGHVLSNFCSSLRCKNVACLCSVNIIPICVYVCTVSTKFAF